MLKNENVDKINNESSILKELTDTCDSFESVVFDAGAGSGKTYALVECIKHISVKNNGELVKHNQKIACITYTNVAANNIKKRIGNTNIVLVSTIHERLWDIIKNQQTTLLELHIDKINKVISDINQELRSNNKYKNYRNLTDSDKETFLKLMLDNRKIFYNYENLKTDQFKLKINSIDGFTPFKNLLINANNFKKLVKFLYRHNDYLECLANIEENKFKTVIYDPKYNSDRLAKMTISHDTVLEYSKKAIEKNPLLRQMVIDKYPYILIDEYQDTSKDVVEIMKMLDDYSKEIKHNFYVAYFGDSAQSIYDGKVGEDLLKIHTGLKQIKKIYNRRSCEEIINIGNKVRNDAAMNQTSIYEDAKQGTVKFFRNKLDINQFISYCKQELNISTSNKLHCLIPKNKDIAELCNFDNLYGVFNNSDYYKGSRFVALNDELLSNDINKLGEVQLIMFKIIKLILDVESDNNPIRNIEQLSNCSDMSLIDLRKAIDELRKIKGDTFEELLNSIFAIYKNGDKNIRLIIESLFDKHDNITLEEIISYLTEKLFNQDYEKIQGLLNLKYDELLNWYRYIVGEETGEIICHTIHGSKGEEYDNVACILSNNFRRDDKFFYNFFFNYEKDSHDEKYRSARNLLYVAFTRAKYNLYILYMDDISDIEENLEKIFGYICDINAYPNKA